MPEPLKHAQVQDHDQEEGDGVAGHKEGDLKEKKVNFLIETERQRDRGTERQRDGVTERRRQRDSRKSEIKIKKKIFEKML